MSRKTVIWRKKLRQAGGNLDRILPRVAKDENGKKCTVPMAHEKEERLRKL